MDECPCCNPEVQVGPLCENCEASALLEQEPSLDIQPVDIWFLGHLGYGAHQWSGELPF